MNGGIGELAANLTGHLDGITDTALNVGPLAGLMVAAMGLLGMRTQLVNGQLHNGFLVHMMMLLGGGGGFTGLISPDALSQLHGTVNVSSGQVSGGTLSDLAGKISSAVSHFNAGPNALMGHFASVAPAACQ